MSTLFNKLEDILRGKLPTNNSGAEVNLSVAESLLLIITTCEQQNIDKSLLRQLKQLYLEGTKTEEEKEFIKEIKHVFFDKNFSVKSDAKTISEDPTRRYFETNLAYRILQNNAQLLETSQLEIVTQNLKQRLFSLPGMDLLHQLKVEKILSGDMDKKLLGKYELEYAELTGKLLNQNYHGLSEKACKNLYQIACNTILATLTTQHDKSMPVDIYSDSIFSTGMDGRGRTDKKSHAGVKTSSKGLMKSTSPLPLYHDLVNPVEIHYVPKEFSPFQRSSDQAGFMIESEWSQQLFSRQTHPYSNGISSTTLAQIRTIILQKRLGNPYFKDNFQEYIAAFSSLMLYNSGGHSFFEIFEVLKLPLCKELLDQELSSALDQDILMYKILYLDQQEEFEKALQDTQSYTLTLLHKKLLNAQFKKKTEQSMELTFESKEDGHRRGLTSIHEVVLHSSAEELEVLLGNQSNLVDVLNYQGWSPLMVAAQLGKTAQVHLLLDAGANINYQVDSFSPLELAIKSQKFGTVEALLEQGAQVKRSHKSKALKERAPALYLACRQNDLRILNAVLEKGTWTINDKKDAILVALKIENLDAVKILMERVTPKEKQKYLSKKYKSSLLKEAVALGNVALIDEIIKFNILSLDDIKWNELVQTSAARGFLPIAKYLLDLTHYDQLPYPSIDRDIALKIALENNHFDMAVLLIIYGANPESIPTRGTYLRSFNVYLQHTQHFDFLFTEKEVGKIQTRAIDIEHTVINRQSHLLHRFLKNLVAFLNRILPNTWRLGYNDKTCVINSVAQIFAKRCVDKIGLDGNNNPEESKEPLGDALEP